MCRIVSWFTHTRYSHSAIIVARCCGARGVKVFNVKVPANNKLSLNSIKLFNLDIDKIECKMNVHKRCQKNVANNCGINPKQVAMLLQEIGISDSSSNTSSSAAGSTQQPTPKPYRTVYT